MVASLNDRRLLTRKTFMYYRATMEIWESTASYNSQKNNVVGTYQLTKEIGEFKQGDKQVLRQLYYATIHGVSSSKEIYCHMV